jgi:hypothetical protein
MFNNAIAHNGVFITSRSDKPHEISLMQDIVDALPQMLRARILHIFCDSKAQAVYSIHFKPKKYAPAARYYIQELLIEFSGGWNGLYFYEDGPDEKAYDDPHWEGDFDQ